MKISVTASRFIENRCTISGTDDDPKTKVEPFEMDIGDLLDNSELTDAERSQLILARGAENYAARWRNEIVGAHAHDYVEAEPVAVAVEVPPISAEFNVDLAIDGAKDGAGKVVGHGAIVATPI